MFAGSTGPHYALIHANSVDAVRAQSLPGIELITFLDYGAPLLNLVRSLSEEVASTPVPSTYATFTVVTEPTAELAVKIPVQDAFDDTCDTPPPTTHWVGRKEELDLLRDRNSKVIAITGIGGQGKSTLAAKYLAEIDAEGLYWDWRDCKEESNTLHTHIVRIIERVTKGQRRAADLAAEKTESVIKLFLNLTLSIRGVFVFDNIDQYVDVYRSKAVEAMHALIDGAIKSAGGCKFVFTARPKLLYEQPTFLQLELDGLTAEEARQLFLARGLTVDPRYVDEVHDLTQGHPLWISLIAMQVLTNRVELAELIGRIRAGKDAGLPSAMLQEIWRSLKPKHQKLLRYLAEMVRPETEKQLAQYVAKELNFNQFTKALRQLKALDLVVVKAPSSAPDTIEMHPLLREFVRRQFSQSERSPYISAIIVFFDQIIVKFRSSLAKDVPYDVLQNWTAKVELLINGGDYEQALSVLDEIRRPLLRSGYAEEFVRLAIALFTDFQLSESAVLDQKVHDDVFKDLVEVLAQLGRFAEAEDYIRRFEQTVAGATARYVALCEMRTYFYWTRGDLELAKEWGKRGGEVKSAGNLDTRHDCGHNLALAQRDSGEVEPALIYFLGGAKIEDVVDPNAIDKTRGGSYYGNIGRCLFIKGDDVGAESCLIKSAWLLEKAQDQLVLLNQGWAAHWLAELFERRNPELAYVFYRRAASRWKLVSPPRAENALGAADRVVKKVSSQVVALADWQVDRKYLDWLDKSRRFRES